MSSIISKKPSVKKLGLLVGSLVLLFGLVLSLGVQTSFAGTVQFKDDANILSSSDESNLQSSGSSLPFNVRVYTTGSYTSESSFQSAVRSNAVSPGIIYGISSNLGKTFVVANNIGIDSSEATSIANTSVSYFKNKDFVGGINAMFSQSRSLASSGSTSGTTSSSTATRSSSGGFPFLGCLIVGIIALVAISVFGAGRRRAMSSGGGVGPGYNPGYGANNNYGPGYGPNYGPGYGGGYGNGYGNQGGGIGPLGGGVIGAGLGGLAGYELGKQAGRNEGGYNNGGFGGVGGNSGGSDWGNSGGNVSGSGGADWGGGGSSDSGFGSGGGSFDAGGGSDWGGGGGDSGGGGGGDSGGSSW